MTNVTETSNGITAQRVRRSAACLCFSVYMHSLHIETSLCVFVFACMHICTLIICLLEYAYCFPHLLRLLAVPCCGLSSHRENTVYTASSLCSSSCLLAQYMFLCTVCIMDLPYVWSPLVILYQPMRCLMVIHLLSLMS